MKIKLGLFPLLFRLGKDEHASILIQFTIYLVAVLGMIGLALDGGRFLLLHSGLQDLADAAALAGAEYLDGTSGAINRATTAAKNMATNNNLRWWDVAGSTPISVQFFSAVAHTGDTPATGDKDARYIKVTTGSWQVAPMFLVAVGASNNSTNASAVAGTAINVCAPVPLMLCNPYESSSSTGDGSSFNPTPGWMFNLAAGADTPSAPGDAGFLCPAGTTSCGATDVRNLLSQQNLGSCNLALMTPKTGSMTTDVKNGINVRFDQQPNGNTKGMDLTPAPIKIDGMAPDASCTSSRSVNPASFVNPTTYNCRGNSCPLPRDNPLPTTGATGIGTGPTSTLAGLNTYWLNHHGATWPTINGTPVTRYQAYRQEIGMTGWLTDGVEQHDPQCSKASVGDFTRRLINVAVIDCHYWALSGGSVNNTPFNRYAQFFLTEPSPDGTVYAEFVQTVTTKTQSSNMHKIVQLVR